jgi:amino acid adenylation domain-containing protein
MEESRPVECDRVSPVLTPAQHKQLAREFNDTQIAYPSDRLIHELFEDQVEQASALVAVVCGDRQLTYSQLNRKANQLARALLASGLQPDQRVGLFVDRSIESVLGMLAVLKAGGAYVPLDPGYPPERLAYMFGNSSLAVLLTNTDLAPRACTFGLPVVLLDEEAHQPDGNLAIESSTSRNLAYVMYTSGSTGSPKGVMIEHRGVLRLVVNTSFARVGSRDCVAHCASPSFDAATWEIWAALLNGSRLLIVPHHVVLDSRALNETLVRNAVTAMWLTVGLFNEYVDALEEAFSGLEYLLVGGDTLDPSIIARALQKPSPPKHIVNGYGPTETTTFASTFPISAANGIAGTLPIGRPIANTCIYILDGNREPAQIGETGEIHIAGDGIARGYIGQPEATAERFGPDPFSDFPGSRMYATGDLGRWHADGNIEHLGRNDSQVKIRGFRVELGEIEAALRGYPGVKQSVVVACEDEHQQKRLIGYVIANHSQLKEQQESPDEISDDMVGQWKSVYEDMYSAGTTDPSFVGWNSSYTGQRIPDEQMHEWLDASVSRIRALHPRRVLEIGCGVGLLVQHLAPHCEVYRATDFSAEALQRLGDWLSTKPELRHVQLERASALELHDLRPGDYDTVIINSVVQAFPDIEYLLSVLQRAAEYLAPGGRIYVGDVRNLNLLKIFHNSVQLERADAGVTVGQLKSRIAWAIERDKELLIDPRFFAELPEHMSGVTAAQILIKHTRSDNELTRYRYDVVLEVGGSRTIVGQQQIAWSPEDPRRVSQLLKTAPAFVRLCGIPSRRLFRNLEATTLTGNSDESTTVGELRELLEQSTVRGEDPETFVELGATNGFKTQVTWHLGAEDGSFDVEWIDCARLPVSTESRETSHSSATNPSSYWQYKAYANDPWGKSLEQMLIPGVREYLEARLPRYMVPGTFVVLDSLPLTPNGKVDRRALPAPKLRSYSTQPFEPPHGQIEECLAGIWQELLRVERVGRQDNFFELGGHSLLVVQMMERLRRFGLSAEVRHVFANRTLAALASTLTGDVTRPVEIPARAIPLDCESITPQMLTLVHLQPEHIQRIVGSVPGGAANVQDIYPLTPLQEGILFHHLREEQRGDPYVVLTLLQLESRARLDSLIDALQAVVNRHDILRTAVQWERIPRPVQVVYRHASLPVEELVLDGGRDALHQLRDLMRPELRRMDMGQAPLMRLQIAASEHEERWYALLHLHHFVIDNRSLQILIDEVRAHVEGNAQTLTEPVAYRAHVVRSLALEQRDHGEKFFRNLLGEVDEPTLPFGLTDVHGDGSRLEEDYQLIEPSLAQKVRSAARRLGVSPATLFHAAWGLVVSATSGRNDVVFGTVVLGRLEGGSGAQRTMGMFVNTLPLRLQLDGVTVAKLLEQTTHGLAGLLDHEQVSLAVAQRCSGVSGGTPLFSAILNYRRSETEPHAGWARVGGVRVVTAQNWTNYPIALSVDDLVEDFALTSQTDRQVDPKRITSYVIEALRALVKVSEIAPTTLARSISVLPESERQLVTESFNATERPYPSGKTIHQLFEEQVRRTPDTIAVVGGGESLSYRELNSRANRVARYITARGARPDQLVGLCVERNVHMVVGIIGTLKAGGAYVPLDPDYPPERLAFVLAHARPRVILTQDIFKGILPQTAAPQISLDGHWNEIAKQDDTDPTSVNAGVSARNLAYVVYTSGSTGEPKGVMIEHGGAVNLWCELDRRYHRPSPCRRIGVNASFVFDASVEQFLQLLSGCTLYLIPQIARTDPQALVRFLHEHEIEGIDCTPSQLQSWISDGLLLKRDTSPLQKVLVGGEAVDGTLWESMAQSSSTVFFNDYGPTECTVECTSANLREGSLAPHIGRPIGNVRIYILDAQFHPVPIGVAGEIFIGGAGVARGYLNRPDLTAERFIVDPVMQGSPARVYKTGDIARWRSDGTIEYLGRNDHQVKIRGYRIELGEIEAQLLRHPQAREAAVLVREDVPGSRRLVAYITLAGLTDAGVAPGAAELRAHAMAVLPAYMVPSVFVVLRNMPLTPSGKLDKRALPAPELDLHTAERYEPPQGETEETLARIWKAVLGVERVGRNDNFFELGGHSLLVMKLVVAIADEFAVRIAVAAIFKSPTVGQMAKRIASLLEYEEFAV